MTTDVDQERVETLQRIDQLESPVARRVIKRIAEGMYSGRLSGADMEILGGIAESMAARSEASLDPTEFKLVSKFRQLTSRQKEGAVMFLSACVDP